MLPKAVFIFAVIFAVSVQLLLAQTQTAISTSYPELNITSGTDDFIVQHQRQYNNNIVDMETQLAAYQVQYRGELSVISTQSELLIKKLDDVQKDLIPLEVLNVLTKHCVQKYGPQIQTADNVKLQIAACVSSANSNYASFVNPPTATVNRLRTYYNTNVRNSINNCKTKHSNSYDNYTTCAVTAIESANTYTISQQKMFVSELQDSKNAGEKRVRQAVECSFNIVYSTDTMVGQTLHSIDNCIDGKDFPAPCVNSTQARSCPFELDVSLNPASYRNATIVNPFYGLDETLPCVQVNFVNNTLLNLLTEKIGIV